MVVLQGYKWTRRSIDWELISKNIFFCGFRCGHDEMKWSKHFNGGDWKSGGDFMQTSRFFSLFGCFRALMENGISARQTQPNWEHLFFRVRNESWAKRHKSLCCKCCTVVFISPPPLAPNPTQIKSTQVLLIDNLSANKHSFAICHCSYFLCAINCVVRTYPSSSLLVSIISRNNFLKHKFFVHALTSFSQHRPFPVTTTSNHIVPEQLICVDKNSGDATQVEGIRRRNNSIALNRLN